MNKKRLLIIILLLTVLTVTIIVITTHKTKYNKYIVNNDKWNDIINSRNISNNISIESIEFNDYNLLINEENNTIYYSVVDIKNKYNPLIKYKTNKKVNIIINDNITDEKLEENNSLKIMIYNNKEYRIYNLVVTKYPILSIKYEENNKRKIDADIYVFDNYVNSAQRVLKSDGILRIIEENKEYSFSLKKESLGHNTRENHISIFGMEKENEYLIKAVNTINEKERYVQLFINNEYKGIYTFGHNEERRIDNFERNRENNK